MHSPKHNTTQIWFALTFGREKKQAPNLLTLYPVNFVDIYGQEKVVPEKGLDSRCLAEGLCVVQWYVLVHYCMLYPTEGDYIIFTCDKTHLCHAAHGQNRLLIFFPDRFQLEVSQLQQPANNYCIHVKYIYWLHNIIYNIRMVMFSFLFESHIVETVKTC